MSMPHLGLQTPNTPGISSRFGRGQTPNPWYNLAGQFTPRNLHDVIKWSRYITTQSPTITEVIRKLSTFPITEFNPVTEDVELKKRYESIIESIDLKNKLEDSGFDHYTIGNVFSSIYFPIHRSLKCPTCKTEHNIRNISYVWKNYQFLGTCPACSSKVTYERIDKKSHALEDINIVKWDPSNIAVNHNPITGESDYYYTIPNNVKNKIRLGDKLFLNSVPWGFIEAVQKNMDFKFKKGSIYHMKNISMGSMLEGLGLPPLISFYSLVFYQAVLRKANEAIAIDYLAPLRSVFPQAASSNGDPVVSMSMAGFAEKVEDALKKHKNDPNHILISPIPLGYQNLGGEGKSLLVSQEIDQAEKTMLLGMGVSIELLSGSTNWTSSTVGLRMLENTMHSYTSQIQKYIDWIMKSITNYLGVTSVDVTMTPFKLTDDSVLKQFMMNLLESGEASMSTLYETFGMDYQEELEKIKQDRVAKAVAEIEANREIEIATFVKSKNVTSDNEDENGYGQAKNQAYELAQQIAGSPAHMRREMLIQIVRKDEATAHLVYNLLPQYGIDQETLMSQEEQMVSNDINAVNQEREQEAQAREQKVKRQESSDRNDKEEEGKDKRAKDREVKKAAKGELEGPDNSDKGKRKV